MLRTVVLSALVATAVLLGMSSQSWAQARHERVEVKAMKSKGKVVGARIKALMRPANGYNRVKLVLGKAKQAGQYDGSTYREAAAGKKPGYVIHEGPAVTVKGSAQPVEFTVKFDAKNGLKPGDKVDLTSLWANGDNPSMQPGHNNSLHVWGMSRNGQNREITLPSK